ncbi:hypothetical protein B0H17DRAFT_1289660 [Mycena rosella]|uniref:Uncharacterized protein n=1 Tax=Mycena rosella TaxID=1033263 RepID=A0AAD7GE47_MYCRO|nr:hypothetical protein B0H17DRAFT_1289660 [Mycena rosella]
MSRCLVGMCVGSSSEYLEIPHECGITQSPWYTAQERIRYHRYRPSQDVLVVARPRYSAKASTGNHIGSKMVPGWIMNQNKYREQDQRVRTIKYDLNHRVSATSTNLSTEAQAGSLRGADSVSTLSIPESNSTRSTGSLADDELVTPPSSAFDATTAPPHSQGAGPDAVPPPAPHGVLEPAAPDSFVLPTGSAAPLHPSAAPSPADDESPLRKPKLLQCLKEKMHVGHAHS